MLIRYEKAVTLLEAFAQTANEMSPEDFGKSVGKFAVDLATGDIVLKGALGLAKQSKYLVIAIQKSEKIADVNKKLSDRAQKVSKSVSEFGDKCKNIFKPTAEVVDAATGTKIPAASLMDNATNAVSSGAQKGTKVVNQTVHVSQIVQEALKDIPAFCKKLDPEICDVSKLEKAIEAFKHMPSAITKDGPIAKVIEGGLDPAKWSSVKGHIYELDVAYTLSHNGEKMIEFGTKWPRYSKKTGKVAQILDVDIETVTKFIECKTWYWANKSAGDIAKFKQQLLKLKEVALYHGKIFELRSKNPVPAQLKEWLQQEAINFIEG